MYVPGTVELRLKVADPGAVTMRGVIEALSPPEVKTARLTLPVKPFRAAIDTVEEATAVVSKVSTLGLAFIEKSRAITVTSTVVVWLKGPLTPTMYTV